MKLKLPIFACLSVVSLMLAASCGQQPATVSTAEAAATSTATKFNGFESQVKWGEHLVKLVGCSDCHTPKKMGPHGPEDDSTLLLSGHPAQMPLPDIDRKMVETKGMAVTNAETAWVGPWGVTFAVNLTPDATGIGSWTEDQWMKVVRQGKWMGLENTRPILPPMPVTSLMSMTDDEAKAIFAYLKSIKPIHNEVPAYMPPVTAKK